MKAITKFVEACASGIHTHHLSMRPVRLSRCRSQRKQVSREVRNACYAFVSLDSAPDPEMVVLSKTAAALTGIPLEFVGATRRENQGAEGAFPPCQLKQVALALTGTVGLEGAQPFSSSYGGHQFGNWAGQLGDGRVATLGEILSDGRSEIGRVAGKEHVAGKNYGGLVEVGFIP